MQKNVQPFREDQPIFSKFNVEEQLDSMFSPKVNLPSGGYLVINPTEALVSVDVNSGKATKEHNIEDTALQTNMEAAHELARQLRLRDMAGLVVIDFIDMEEKRNIRNVERKLKDSLKNDRARIQVGRISHFGLLEMSRQRIRFGVLESSTNTCPTCNGTGLVRSVESLALMVMRAIEDQVMRRPNQAINVKVASEVALYILNAKRPTLSVLEQRYNLAISITAEPHMHGDQFTIEKGDPYDNGEPRITNHVKVDSAPVLDLVEDPDPVDIKEDEEDAKEEKPSRRRKRRRGKGREREDSDNQTQHENQDSSDKAEATAQDETSKPGDDDDGEQPKKRRRRGRRGGRRNRRNQDNDNGANTDQQDAQQSNDNEKSDAQSGAQDKVEDKVEAPASFDQEAVEAVEENITRVQNATDADAETSKEAALVDAKLDTKAETLDDEDAKAPPAKPKRRPRRKKAEDSANASPKEDTAKADDSKSDSADAEEKPKRRRAPRKRVKKR